MISVNMLETKNFNKAYFVFVDGTKVVLMTTSGAAIDNKVGILITLGLSVFIIMRW